MGKSGQLRSIRKPSGNGRPRGGESPSEETVAMNVFSMV